MCGTGGGGGRLSPPPLIFGHFSLKTCRMSIIVGNRPEIPHTHHLRDCWGRRPTPPHPTPPPPNMPLARPKRIPKWTQFGILVFNTVWTCFMYYKPVRWVQCGPITHFLHFANVTGTPNTIFLSFVKPVQTGANRCKPVQTGANRCSIWFGK